MRVTPDFKLGDLVFVEATRTPAHVPSKLMVLWNGPFEVTKVSTDGLTYSVTQGAKTFVRHANNLMRWVAPRQITDEEPQRGPPIEQDEKKGDDEKYEKKKLPLSPLLHYKLAEIENGSFLIVQFIDQRYLVRADSVEGDLVWVQFYRTRDAHRKTIDRKYFPVWEDQHGEERWPPTGKPGETALWTQIGSSQIFYKFSQLSHNNKIPPDVKRRWDEVYGDKEEMCV